MILWLSMFLQEVFCQTFYHFGSSSGQIFRDRVFNSKQVALSGFSPTPDISDVNSTDRGVYLPHLNSGVKLPPNSLSSESMMIKSSFTAALWFMCLKESDGIIFYRNANIFDFISILHSSNLFRFNLKFKSEEILFKSVQESLNEGNLYAAFWVMIGFTIDGKTIKVYFDDSVAFNAQLNEDYIETSVDFQSLGSVGNGRGTIGFIWYYLEKFEIVSFSSIFSSQMPTSCLNEGCGSCDQKISIVDEVLNKVGCLSNLTNPQVTPQGPCPGSCKSGCVGGVCLDCPCLPSSCILKSGSVDCHCSVDSIQVNNDCICSQTNFYNDGNNCLPCSSECQTCKNFTSCLSCRDANAHVESGVCICNNGFFSNTSLMILGSCLPCDNKCLTCNSIGCFSCIENASLNNKSTCVCDKHFYQTVSENNKTVCKKCHPHCKRCLNETYCLECIVENALVSNIGCECPQRFYPSGDLEFSSSLCLPCLDECLSCSNDSSCIECYADSSIINSVTICACEQGFFQSSSMTNINSCRVCNFDCLECDKMNMCLSCKAKNTIIDLNGRCACNHGFFKTDSYSNENACSPCNIDCETCDNEFTCITCKNNFMIPSETVGCVCQAGTYMSQDPGSQALCLPCHINCLSCSDSKSCIVCKSPEGLVEEMCVCPKTTYFDGKNCRSCMNGCEVCSNPEVCLKCLIDFTYPEKFCTCKLQVINNQCVCPDLFFELQDDCHTCIRWITRNDIKVESSKDLNFVRININEHLQLSENFRILDYVTNKDIFGDSYIEIRAKDNENEFLIEIGENHKILIEDLCFNMTTMRAENIECGFRNEQIIFFQLVKDTDKPVPKAKISSIDSLNYQCNEPKAFSISGLESSLNFGIPFNCSWTLVGNPEDVADFEIFYYAGMRGCLIWIELGDFNTNFNIEVELNVFTYYGKKDLVRKSVKINRLADFEVQLSENNFCTPGIDCEISIEKLLICPKKNNISYEWMEIKNNSLNNSFDPIHNTSRLLIKKFTQKPGVYTYKLVVRSEGFQLVEKIFNVKINQVNPVIIFDKSSGTISSMNDFYLDASKSFDPNNFGKQGELNFQWTYCLDSDSCIVSNNLSANFISIPKEKLILKKILKISLKTTSKLFPVSETSTFEGKVLNDYIPNLKIVDKITLNQPQRIPLMKKTSMKFLSKISEIEMKSINWTFGLSINGTSPTFKVFPALHQMESKVYTLTLKLFTLTNKKLEYFYDIQVNSPPRLGSFQYSATGTLIELITEILFEAKDWIDPENDYPLKYYFAYGNESSFRILQISSSALMRTPLAWVGENTKMFLRVYDTFEDYSEKHVNISIVKSSEIEIEMYFIKNQEVKISNTIPQIISNVLASTLMRNYYEHGFFVYPDDTSLKYYQIIFNYSISLIERFRSESTFNDLFLVQINLLLIELTSNPALRTDFYITKNLEVTSNNFQMVLNIIQNLIIQSNSSGIDVNQANQFLKILTNIFEINDFKISSNDINLFKIIENIEKISQLSLKRIENDEFVNLTSGNIESSLFVKNIKTFDEEFRKAGSNFSVTLPKNVIQNTKDDFFDLGIVITHYKTLPYMNSAHELISLNLYNLTGEQKFEVNTKTKNIEIEIPVNFSYFKDKKNIQCKYYDEKDHEWSKKGCTKKQLKFQSIVCACEHLTTFAGFDANDINYLKPVKKYEFTKKTLKKLGFLISYTILLMYVVVMFLLNCKFSCNSEKCCLKYCSCCKNINKEFQKYIHISTPQEFETDSLNELTTNVKKKNECDEKDENNNYSCATRKNFIKKWIESFIFFELKKAEITERQYIWTKFIFTFSIDLYMDILAFWYFYKDSHFETKKFFEESFFSISFISILVTFIIDIGIKLIIHLIEHKFYQNKKSQKNEESQNNEKSQKNILMMIYIILILYCIYSISCISTALHDRLNEAWLICLFITVAIDFLFIRYIEDAILECFKNIRCMRIQNKVIPTQQISPS